MHGMASSFLPNNLNVLLGQTFKDFEVVITDNSEDDVIKNICENEKYRSLDIKYTKNNKTVKKGISQNTNEAVKKASGELIKILYLDDYLASENSLQDIVDNFKGNWLVTGCGHDEGDGKIINLHFPTYNDKIYMGKNTIGSPSVLTIKNEDLIFFDENLTWLLDCDYYRRLYEKYGEPTILNKINVVIGIGKYQTTNHLNRFIKRTEYKYVKNKYATNQDHKNIISKLFKWW